MIKLKRSGYSAKYRVDILDSAQKLLRRWRRKTKMQLNLFTEASHQHQTEMSLQIFVCPNSANSYIQLIKEEPQSEKEEPDHPWI